MAETEGAAMDSDAQREGHADPTPPATHAIEVLPEAECWRLLVHGRLGRLAVDATDGAPDIFPVNYVASPDRRLYLRSAPGSKLMAIAALPAVAFEIDGYTDDGAWSVVVRGVAERLDADDEIEASGVLQLVSWSPTAKHDFVRITPRTISGRSFRMRDSLAGVPDDRASHHESGGRSRPPQAIPRHSPPQ
jgi:hypothetical protein